MHTETVLLLMLVALSAGFVDAIAGGGGLLTLPALLMIGGLPPHLALATNKGQSVFGALMSAWSYFRHGKVDLKRAPVAFTFGFVGSLLGARAVLSIRPEPLRPVVIGLLLFAAIVMVARRKVHVTKRNVASPRAAMAAIAIVLGAYDGFFGPGVGAMLVVAAMLVFGDSTIEATANAKVVNFASNLAAFALFAASGKVQWALSLPMACASITGAFIGSRMAIRRGDGFIRAFVLLVVSIAITKLSFDLYGQWRHAAAFHGARSLAVG